MGRSQPWRPRGFREIDGQEYSLASDGTWRPVVQYPADTTADEPQLWLVLQQQEGKDNHWALFVGREFRPGMVYQVVGDNQCMRYGHRDGVNIMGSRSFLSAYPLTPIDAATASWVEYYAFRESPPRADNMLAVRETCAGWALRVVRRLYEHGIVPEDKLIMVERMVPPIGW